MTWKLKKAYNEVESLLFFVQVNMEFSMPEKREEIEITTGSHVVTDNSSVGKSPWAAKNNSSKNNNSNRSTEKEKQQKPSDWLNKMFDKS